jgi:hypothetical protein
MYKYLTSKNSRTRMLTNYQKRRQLLLEFKYASLPPLCTVLRTQTFINLFPYQFLRRGKTVAL